MSKKFQLQIPDKNAHIYVTVKEFASLNYKTGGLPDRIKSAGPD